MKKFSLILPVYNVEDYLAKCLESCINQNIQKEEYEIIVVIDGSPDNSYSIALDYQKRFNNIIIIEKTNGGLSDARNFGLERAKGEFVWFIDSDDFIEPNILSEIYEILKSNSLECLWLRWRNVNSNGITIPSYEKNINNAINEIMTGYSFMENVLETYLPAWSFIYNIDYLRLHQLKYTKGMYYEDADFAYRSLPHIKRIRLYNRICYNYQEREGSIITHTTIKKLRDICTNIVTAHNLYLQNIKQCKLALFYKKSYSAFLLFAIKYYLRNRDQESLKIVLSIINGYKIEKIYTWGNIKNKTIARFYNIFGRKSITLIFKLLAKK